MLCLATNAEPCPRTTCALSRRLRSPERGFGASRRSSAREPERGVRVCLEPSDVCRRPSVRSERTSLLTDPRCGTLASAAYEGIPAPTFAVQASGGHPSQRHRPPSFFEARAAAVHCWRNCAPPRLADDDLLRATTPPRRCACRRSPLLRAAGGERCAAGAPVCCARAAVAAAACAQRRCCARGAPPPRSSNRSCAAVPARLPPPHSRRLAASAVCWGRGAASASCSLRCQHRPPPRPGRAPEALRTWWRSRCKALRARVSCGRGASVVFLDSVSRAQQRWR